MTRRAPIGSLFALPALALALALMSCQPLSPEERMRRMAPVFGQRDVTYVAGTDSGALPIGSVVSVSETLGVHRRLDASEAEILRELAQRRYDDFVVAEMRALKPEFERQKRAVRKRTASRVATARRRPPAAAAAREEQLRDEEQAALAEIDKRWRRSALIRVEEKYGNDLAIPIKSRDRKPVVAITRVEDGEVKPPDRTFELDRGGGDGTVRHRGREATVIGGEVELDGAR